MHDYGNEAAEKAINELNKKIQDVYKEAEKDLQKKMDEFVRKYKFKEQKYLEQVAEGKISQADFDAWKRGQVFQGRQWRTKQRSIADVLYRSGEVSTKIINEMALGVCAENVNWADYTIEHGFGVDFGFNLYDESTVANLIKKEPDILPKWKIEKEKNYIWNKKKLNNAVTQGIIQGEKLDEIAKRVAVGLSGSDQNLMKTFAATAMTGAQNSGRNISYKNAQKLGINLKKEWLATLDMRTRTSHRELDGQKADIDEPFKVDGEEIRFPGDPTAKAYLIYNCRCTMIADLVDYPAEEYDRYDNIEGKPVKGMSYEEWAKAKGYAKTTKPKNGGAVNTYGKKIIVDERLKEEVKETIEKLTSEYNTHLEEVKRGNRPYNSLAAGSVDVTGTTMYISENTIIPTLHEFAHTIANSRADKLGLTNNEEFWKEIKKVKRQYRKDVDKEQDVKRYISSYEHSRNGDGAIDEFFAEAFTHAKAKEMGVPPDRRYGTDYTYSSRVLEIVDKYFKRNKKP